MNQKTFESIYFEFNEKLKKREFEEALLLVPFMLNKANNQIDRFYALMGEATALTSLNKHEEVISIYKEIIAEFADNKNEVISKFLAFAYYNQALIYAKQKNYKKERDTYNKLLVKYIDDISPELEIVLVKSFLNKAICICELKDENRALEVYRELVVNFQKSTNNDVLVNVAQALYNMALIYGKNNNHEESIKIYDELISKFNQNENQYILELYVKSLVNKASRLKDLNKNIEAINIYNEVIEKFEAYTGTILNQVAIALHNKTIILSQLQDEKELLKTCDFIIERFSNTKHQMVLDIVSSAQVIKDKDRFNNNSW